jgi:predicted metal-binding membrane protein
MALVRLRGTCAFSIIAAVGLLDTSVLHVSALHASIVPRVSLDEMAGTADSIVEGRVVRSWAVWDAAHRFIWTHHELAVREWLKGPAARAVIVSEPGGTVDGLTMRIAGVICFSASEDVVLFLYRTPIGYLRVAGYGQGKYGIASDGRVRAGASGIDLVRATGEHRTLKQRESLDGMPLSEFKSRVRAAVARAESSHQRAE